MKKQRFTEEQIIAVLKEQEAGTKVADLCRKQGISEATFYNWKAKYGGMEVSEAKRLKALEDENAKGLLVFETVKTGVLCELPIHAELQSALPRDNMTFLLSDAGKPFESDKALSQRVSKWFQQAGITGITAHSVRKWRATKMAEAGATKYQLMASFGWRDPQEARPYVQAASRQRLAQEAADKIAGV